MTEFFERLEDAPPINRPLALGAVTLVIWRQAVLLEKRADNGQWSFPGGSAEPGEEPALCAARELKEETGLCGLDLEFVKLFDDPGTIGAYADGNVVQTHVSVFKTELDHEPHLRISKESTALAFFSHEDLVRLDLAPSHNPIRKLAIELLKKASA